MTSPMMTVLNYSGGQGSSCLLWLVMDGVLPRPQNFVTIRANPGMEKRATYAYADAHEAAARALGIECYVAPGRDLYQDIITLHDRRPKRFDNPPFFLKKPDGKRGMLAQQCTQEYKIRPMDRVMRRLLHEKCGINPRAGNIGSEIVDKWIGLSADEPERFKRSPKKYVRFRYPLAEMGWTKPRILEYFRDMGREPPPRSVCNGCFANSASTYKAMRATAPEDYAQAKAVDAAVRDMSALGVKHPVYINDSLMSLDELEAIDFAVGGDDDEASCDMGYCFT